MVIASGKPASGYKFNSFEEIKSHSSILFNERMAILFYLLDMKSISMNTNNNLYDILEVRALLKQIYKNIRSLLYYNPLCRATLDLQTKDDGIYVTDVIMGLIDRMIDHCEIHGYTTQKMWIIVRELNNFEVIQKNILQYFHYFIRPEFRQKPDIDIATESYKEIADSRTVEELRDIVGENNLIDFDNLGIKKVSMSPPVQEKIEEEKEEDDDEPDEKLMEYDEAVDGDLNESGHA